MITGSVATDSLDLINALIVDDDKDQLMITKVNLENVEPRLKIHTNQRPSDVLELLRVASYDCVISDYKMPTLNGIQLCVEVRSFSTVPFIVYTAQGSEEVASAALAAGADDYVRKDRDLGHYSVLANRVRHIVERRRAEKKLLDSRRDLNRAQALSMTGSWRLDVLHDELTWSDETHRMFGVPAGEQMNYESFLRIVHPDDRAFVDDSWNAALKGDTYDIEHRVLVDGGVKWVRERAELEFGEDGVLLGGFGTVQDITDRKAAELALNDREAELSAILSGSPIPMFVVDKDRRVTLVNAAVEALTGRSFMGMKGLRGGEALRCLHSLDDPKGCGFGPHCDECVVRESVVETLESSREIHQQGAELHLFCDNGMKHMSVLVSTAPLQVGGEKSVLVCVEDVSKLVENERELQSLNDELSAVNEELTMSGEELQRYSSQLEEMVEARTRQVIDARERLESFMNGATEAFFIYDKDLRLVELNPSALAIYPEGTRKGDLLGRDILALAPGIVNTPMYEGYKKVLLTGEPYRVDDVLVIASLGKRWVSIHAFKMGDFLGILRRDVTERVVLEEKLRESQRLEAIDRISAMVAHDVRNPLNIAAQALHMVKRGPERAEEMLDMVERNINRAIGMIEELRENTRLIEARKVNVNLVALIEEIIRENPLREGVRLESSYGEGLEEVSVDISLLRRVLENLLLNAVEAMPGGGVVKVEVRRDNGVVISVSDTGVGITEEARESIFTPLYTTKAKGVGLGLSFCKRAVEAHGGSISFTSELGYGTTFTIRIPS